jgi:hypothetical protein
MNDQELTYLLREARAQSPEPTPRFATRTVQEYRARLARPSFIRRHWRLASAAAVLVIIGGAVAIRPSTGSPLPPEYDRPGIVASGHMGSRQGWAMDYYTVVRPWRPGTQVASFTGSSITETKGRRIVFHRYLGDGDSKVYFGYDVVLQADGMSGKLTFRPLSVEPEDMPSQLRAAGSRIVAVQQLPAKTFESGQNVVITLLTHPETGQQVIDYVHVDTNFFIMMHQVVGNMITAFHHHFHLPGPPNAERELHPVQ